MLVVAFLHVILPKGSVARVPYPGSVPKDSGDVCWLTNPTNAGNEKVAIGGGSGRRANVARTFPKCAD